MLHINFASYKIKLNLFILGHFSKTKASLYCHLIKPKHGTKKDNRVLQGHTIWME